MIHGYNLILDPSDLPLHLLSFKHRESVKFLVLSIYIHLDPLPVISTNYKLVWVS